MLAQARVWPMARRITGRRVVPSMGRGLLGPHSDQSRAPVNASERQQRFGHGGEFVEAVDHRLGCKIANRLTRGAEGDKYR